MRVHYEIRDLHTNYLFGKCEKEFVNEVEKRKFENMYSGHPTYYLVITYKEQNNDQQKKCD